MASFQESDVYLDDLSLCVFNGPSQGTIMKIPHRRMLSSIKATRGNEDMFILVIELSSSLKTADFHREKVHISQRSNVSL